MEADAGPDPGPTQPAGGGGTDHLETETKHSVDDDAELPSFAGLAGVASVDPPVEQDLEADYFDTEDLRLARLGITLRRRTGGADAGWHLKVPIGGSRHEAHEPLTDDGAPPRPLVDALDGLVRGRAVSRLVTLRTSRAVHRLRDASGAVLAEVADDRVRAEWAPGETTWREWEVELVQGGPALLGQVARRIETAEAEPAAYASKLARALGERGAAVDSGPGDDRTPGTAREVVGARLRELVADLMRWDVLVRRDAPDSVHQMRVTVRRLRSALATFRPLYDRGRTEPLRAELKWLGLLLGAARDAEVLRDRIGDLAEGEHPPLLDAGTIVFTHRELARRYRDSHERLLQELRSPRYAALADGLGQLVTDPPWGPGGDREVGALRACVRRDWQRVVAAVAAADAAGDVEGRHQGLHEARKAAKRARYAAEPLVPIYGADAERFVRAVARLQEPLGDLNDALVALRELPRLPPSESGHEHDARTLEALHARERQAAAESEARFRSAWPKARRTKVVRWLD